MAVFMTCIVFYNVISKRASMQQKMYASSIAQMFKALFMTSLYDRTTGLIRTASKLGIDV